MKRGGGKRKGSAFERTIAIVFREKFNLDAKHCYRTPLSGGHFAARRNDPGDLVFSPAFQNSLPIPICVECKNQKDWKIGRFWENLKAKRSWPETQALKQAIEAAGTTHCAPVLIFKYHQDKEIWCCVPPELHIANVRALRFKFMGRLFFLAKLNAVLDSWILNEWGNLHDNVKRKKP